MSFLKHIADNFTRFKDRRAFYIRERFYTYGQLESVCSSIAGIINKNISGRQSTVGVIGYDNLETYASVLALWFTGNIFVPLNPRNPEARNIEIIKQAGIKSILTSDGIAGNSLISENASIIITKNLERNPGGSLKNEIGDNDILYLLFTSGSTGTPKGVPISARNLDSFINGFIARGYEFTPDDRFLQIYDLSFDASVHCYTVPLVTGSCIYTVPQDEIKYLFALKLMNNHELSCVKMPPSTLSYLRPYFQHIRLEKLRYCLFGGEALDQKLVSDWSDCIPNARIQNVYGPTEATINCLIYDWDKKREDKQFNGIVSIGKPFGDNIAIVADMNLKTASPGEMGELCIAGSQITPGYWNNQEKNNEAFVKLEIIGKKERFYRTGDMAIIDQDGDFLFCGRKDEQVQIDGFRVELGEIEHHAREFLKIINVAAVAVRNRQETLEIHLFAESLKVGIDDLKKHLESMLPPYMQPVRIHKITEFPKSAGGKIDKQALRMLISEC